jgi:hypothetical protein
MFVCEGGRSSNWLKLKCGRGNKKLFFSKFKKIKAIHVILKLPPIPVIFDSKIGEIYI